MTRRRWVKVWTQETLYGTTSSELDPSERWIWIGLLLLAGDSPIPGTICAAPDVPFTDDQLAKILKVPVTHLMGAKEKMVGYGKIDLNSGGIHIHNWEHYQADYVRMQRSRERAASATNVAEGKGATNVASLPD